MRRSKCVRLHFRPITPLLHYFIPKLVPEVGIAPTSPRLRRGANLPQLLGELVVPAGNGSAFELRDGWGELRISIYDFRAGWQCVASDQRLRKSSVANFRSNWRKASVMLRPRLAPILFSRQVQPAYICLPSINGQGDRSCTCDLHLRTVAL